MIFLIEYDRVNGKLMNLRTFDDSDRQNADTQRLDLEIDVNRRGIEREIVLLEATNETALRKTHRRYFETLDELARAS